MPTATITKTTAVIDPEHAATLWKLNGATPNRHVYFNKVTRDDETRIECCLLGVLGLHYDIICNEIYPGSEWLYFRLMAVEGFDFDYLLGLDEGFSESEALYRPTKPTSAAYMLGLRHGAEVRHLVLGDEEVD